MDYNLYIRLKMVEIKMLLLPTMHDLIKYHQKVITQTTEVGAAAESS